jgi:hypothetical protein
MEFESWISERGPGLLRVPAFSFPYAPKLVEDEFYGVRAGLREVASLLWWKG